MWVTEEVSLDPGSRLEELVLKVAKNFQDHYVFLVMNSAAVFSWEMGPWLVKTDMLLKRKITQEREKQTSKEAGCGENKSETNLFSRKWKKIYICRGKTGGKIGVFPEGDAKCPHN